MNLNPWKAVTIGLAAFVVGGASVLIGTHLGSGSPSRPPAASSPSPRTTDRSSAAPLLVTPDWSGVKPSSITLSADGGNIPYDLTWSQWNDESAVGKGLVAIESCNPNCAQGTSTPVPVRIVLSIVQGGHYTFIAEIVTGRPNPTRGTAPITARWPFGAS
jgi:hypothetical protein